LLCRTYHLSNFLLCTFCQGKYNLIRDRPFNLKGRGGYGFLFCSEFFFRTTQELEYLFFLSRKAQVLFPEFNIRLYDKNSESDYYIVPPPKSDFFFSNIGNQNIFFSNIGNQNIFFNNIGNQNIFFSNIGNQNIFLEKKP
jgi:hypothetical protein